MYALYAKPRLWCDLTVVWGSILGGMGNTSDSGTVYYIKLWFEVLRKMVKWGITPNCSMGVAWGSTLDGVG